jgi:hypothetical protein
MPRYYFNFAGYERDATGTDCDDLDAARNAAVRKLGTFLADHPAFADEGHWRVDVENDMGQLQLHLIVATVTPRQGAADE